MRNLFALLLSSALLVACSSEMMDCNCHFNRNGLSYIVAEYENHTTKTVLDTNLTSVLWSPGDMIRVYSGSSSAIFTSTNTVPESKTVFIGTTPVIIGGCEGSTDKIWAVYPSNSAGGKDGNSVIVSVYSQQSSVSNSFAPEMFPSVGCSDNFNIQFYNICGGLRFSVTEDDIIGVVLFANNNEMICGKAYVGFDESGHPTVSQVANGSSCVSLYAPNNKYFEVGKWYYLTMLPQELSKGFYLRIVKKDFSFACLYHDTDVSIKRSVFGTIPSVDENLSFSQDYTDLSESETANCYIVNKAGNYKFNAMFKGNSEESVGSPSSAEVLWESFGTNDGIDKGDIITYAVLDGDYVKFGTTKTLTNGNAVIAVKDNDGKILWSWHIWVCDGYVPANSDQLYNDNHSLLMDRNLGATSVVPGSSQTYGLLYQWGRKDPMIGGTDAKSVAKSSSVWPEYVCVSDVLSNGNAQDYADSHPMTFIGRNSAINIDDWYCTSASNQNNALWGSDNEKSMYDPCPPGYAVPHNIWGRSPSEVEYCESNNGVHLLLTNGNIKSWYQCAGHIGLTTGEYGGNTGYYWSRDVDGHDAKFFVFTSTGPAGPDFYARVSGNSVRCQLESSFASVNN